MTLRALLALVVLVLLVRVARVSWQHRALTVAVWRAVRWHHLLGATALLVIVAGTASLLVATVPGADLGLGRLVGTSANAVFAPLEEGLARAAPPPTGPDWPLLVGATAFLVPFALLLPWLAFVEEEVFRAGLEAASWPRVALASLAFGLVHLVMLVPIGAAVAVGVAGFAYALAYRHGHRTVARDRVPAVAIRAFRPTARSRRALPRTGAADPADAPDPTAPAIPPELPQAAGVFSAAVWHATFNTLVVVVVWASMVLAALT